MKKILGFFLLLFVLVLAPVRAQDSSLEEIKKQVVKIGKLSFTRAITVRYMNRENLTSYISQLIENEYPQEQAEKEVEFGMMMGFFDKRFSLREMRKKLILENIGGLYNEKAKELVALEEFRSVDMFNALALIHELRHAVQDQHFNISNLIGSYSDFDDRSLAVLAALEGDATLLMVQYMGIDPDMVVNAFQPETIFSFASIPGISTLVKAPGLIKYQMLMPYLNGLKFSAFVLKKKKWSGINQVLRQPPQSSEQILHPGKYIKREAPMTVAIRFQPSKGWQTYFSGVVGEYFLNVLLMNSDEVADIGSGWGGDLFCLYKKSSSRLLVWKSIWDTESDCSRFYSDFRRFLERKFKVELGAGNMNRKQFLAGQTDVGYFLLHREGQKVFFVRTDDRNEINTLIDGGIYD